MLSVTVSNAFLHMRAAGEQAVEIVMILLIYVSLGEIDFFSSLL